MMCARQAGRAGQAQDNRSSLLFSLVAHFTRVSCFATHGHERRGVNE